MITSTDDATAATLLALAQRAAPAVRASDDTAARALAAARARRHTIRRRRVAVGVVLGLAASGAIAAALLPGHSPYATVDEPSATMTPTVQAGDDVVVAKNLKPAPGDVVEVTWEADGQHYDGITRVIGVSGETVSCPPVGGRCAGVIVDRRRLAETYLAGPTLPFAAVTVPAGHVFLLSDNRSQARDSRELGSVPLDRVKGVVVRILHDGRSTAVPGAPLHAGPGDGQNVDPPTPPPSASTGSG